jgi:hypothetical protein
MRRNGARPPAAKLTILALVALVGACAVIQPKPWDRNPDSGPLQVFGADPTSPGQQVFQALLREPSLESLLTREGEPDTLEVLGTRRNPKQILLMYTRKGAGRPRRIVLDSAEDGFIARVPEPLATPAPAPKRARRPARPRKTREPAAVRANEPSGEPTPTARQQLECPIDSTRADCQALCRGGAAYEWCR